MYQPVNVVNALVLVRVPIADIKHHDQQQLGEEGMGSAGNSQITPSWREVRVETQDRDLKAGTEPEAAVSGLLSVVCSACILYSEGPSAQRAVGLGPLTSIHTHSLSHNHLLGPTIYLINLHPYTHRPTLTHMHMEQNPKFQDRKNSHILYET